MIESSEADFSRWMKWGWIPLVAGSAALTILVLAAWEILTRSWGFEVEGTWAWLLLARAAVLSVVLTGWSGWFAWRSLHRIENARASFRARQAEVESQARQTERLAELGALSRELAHEIKNPLNSLNLNSVVLKRSLAAVPPEIAERCLRLVEIQSAEIQRLNQLVEDYLGYGSAGTALARTPVSWQKVVEEVVEVHRAALSDRKIDLEVVAATGLPLVLADPAKLRQVVHNLVRNEIDALSPGGTVRLTLSAEDRFVCMVVTDDGPGFSQPESVFRPSYSTKGAGHGLGLAVVSDIVRAHGGQVLAGNVGPHGGATITVRVPLVAAAS